MATATHLDATPGLQILQVDPTPFVTGEREPSAAAGSGSAPDAAGSQRRNRRGGYVHIDEDDIEAMSAIIHSQ